jgi:polysaccharide pyruvyl transferase WcaK-like protein
LDPVYFLDFKSQATRKLSYAASFGSTRLPNELHQSARSYLRSLNSVSVRERLGADFASALIDRKVDCVPDPTFLLEDYSDLVDTNSGATKDHIFFYILRSAEGSHRIADALTQELKLPVISGFNPLRRWTEIGQVVPGGPKEWLNALAGSKLVVSNSFHATAFSLLLNVPFIALRLPGKRSRLSARLQSVLTDVGLEDRIIEAGDRPAALRLAREEIDWTPVNERIDQMRVHGQSYLLENLGKMARDPMPLQSTFEN